MRIEEAIKSVSGFRFVTDQLDFCSAVGRAAMLRQPWLVAKEEVDEETGCVERMLDYAGGHPEEMGRLRSALSHVKEIGGTLKRVADGAVLDDVEFFEVKNFALAVLEVKRALHDFPAVELPDLSMVFSLLDPEHTGVAHFYIYDSYAAELGAMRKRYRAMQLEGRTAEEMADLYAGCVEREDAVREWLSFQLRPYAPAMERDLDALACLDLWQAKARLAETLGLCRPIVQPKGEGSAFVGLFHPEVWECLKQEGKAYQPVDIRLGREVTLITGANMGGKTVLLKSLALAQCLCQFGFYVPAANGAMELVDDVAFSGGDGQNESLGLSSFAAEMTVINGIIRRVREGENLLVLVDEPARTTNPTEGRAIVSALVALMDEAGVLAVVTTHYAGVTGHCRRLRVRGFREELAKEPVTLRNLASFVDYSVVEDEGGEVPMEALRMAEIMGVDEELVRRARIGVRS